MNGLIAAISTAWGESGISVVRVSGKGSRDLVDGFFRGGVSLGETPPRFMRNGFITDNDGAEIDEVLAVWFREPKSYTGEEMAEIQCHGGTVAARRCLERCISLGARMALPGEFTRRAFMNGRIDLAQAESVLGIIRARSDRSLRSAAKCLQGSLSARVKKIDEELLELSALGEASLDYPEEDIPTLEMDFFIKGLSKTGEKIRTLLSSARSGRFLREGVRVAIAGRPNVGKSSLMNAFLQESRSIVTSLPGTTRDIIEEVITHKGIPLRLVDTAGIRLPKDPAEQEGVERAREAVQKSDIRVWVIDGSEPLSDDDLALSTSLQGTCHVVALNKSDLPQAVNVTDIIKILPGADVRVISTVSGEGIESLKDLIVLSSAGITSMDEDLNTTERQITEMSMALDLVINTMDSLTAGAPVDTALETLSEARSCLGRIIGVDADESLMEKVFSSFCIGK
ncbi:MAG TPA: tRNA uridine-5-carboxymethylaminomethyl(34) synthesis GTPase MnmE [Thermovirgaceae bacterium]|jgi:tRNA modification GTPase|nr:tRNA uridine-5-carboxymethylaminomethyl(34) synthesis GTPase MnmE [Thermovirgaceae bacterium]